MRITSTLLLAPLFPLALAGCDDPAAREYADRDNAATAPAVDLEIAAEDPPALELLMDGDPRPDRLIAAVEADPDTTIYFAQGEEDEDGRFVVDVMIHGRDGGFDYGGLLTSGEATPLELFLALTADEDEEAPEALRLAHGWQIEATRPGDAGPRDLTTALPPPQAAFEDILHTDESAFTCLSWANFETYMGSRFAGAPGRVEILDSAVGADTLYSPEHPSGWWPTSQVDMVACNYNSSNSGGYNDTIDAELCYVRGFGGALTTNCGHAILDDGYYLRRIYGPIMYYRQYKINVAPLSAAALQSFSGIVKRDA